MKIVRSTNNWNKVNTKEELLELLKKTSIILNKSTEEYLTSLIELDFSVIRDYISNEERDAIKELEIYQKAAIYNIYNRAIALFENNNIPVVIDGHNKGLENLAIWYPYFDKKIRLFTFNYSGQLSINRITSDSYESREIGSVVLFQTLENKELREKELDSIMLNLEQLYDAKNPYRRPNYRKINKIGGSYDYKAWNRSHSQEIKEYEKMFTELDTKKELTEEEKKEIEITNEAYNLLLEDYGLTIDSFSVIKPSPTFGLNHQSMMQKTLVKKMPNLTISTNIKYI